MQILSFKMANNAVGKLIQRENENNMIKGEKYVTMYFVRYTTVSKND